MELKPPRQTGNTKAKYLRQQRILKMQLSLGDTPETIKSIAERFGLAIVTVSGMLRELEDSGLVLSIRVKTGPGNKTKFYYRADTPRLYPTIERPIYKSKEKVKEKFKENLPFEDSKLCALMGFTNIEPPEGEVHTMEQIGQRKYPLRRQEFRGIASCMDSMI
jgi:predicted transcriptional regulator